MVNPTISWIFKTRNVSWRHRVASWSPLSLLLPFAVVPFLRSWKEQVVDERLVFVWNFEETYEKSNSSPKKSIENNMNPIYTHLVAVVSGKTAVLTRVWPCATQTGETLVTHDLVHTHTGILIITHVHVRNMSISTSCICIYYILMLNIYVYNCIYIYIYRTNIMMYIYICVYIYG